MARPPASGTQHALRAGDYEAVVASVGATLRSLTYQGRDQVGGEPSTVQSCSGGSMKGSALSLPDAFLAGLKLSPPDFVTALEGRPGGWVGLGGRFPGAGRLAL